MNRDTLQALTREKLIEILHNNNVPCSKSLAKPKYIDLALKNFPADSNLDDLLIKKSPAAASGSVLTRSRTKQTSSSSSGASDVFRSQIQSSSPSAKTKIEKETSFTMQKNPSSKPEDTTPNFYERPISNGQQNKEAKTLSNKTISPFITPRATSKLNRSENNFNLLENFHRSRTDNGIDKTHQLYPKETVKKEPDSNKAGNIEHSAVANNNSFQKDFSISALSERAYASQILFDPSELENSYNNISYPLANGNSIEIPCILNSLEKDESKLKAHHQQIKKHKRTENILVFFGLILIAISFLYGMGFVRSKTYCDSNPPILSTHNAKNCDIVGSRCVSDCKKCPVKGVCKAGRFVECQEGYIKYQNTISKYLYLNNLEPQKCIPTFSDDSVIQMALEIENILGKRYAEYLYNSSTIASLFSKSRYKNVHNAIERKNYDQPGFAKHIYNHICLGKEQIFSQLKKTSHNKHVFYEAVRILLQQQLIFSLENDTDQSYSLSDQIDFKLGSNHPVFLLWEYIWVRTHMFVSENMNVLYRGTILALILSTIAVLWHHNLSRKNKIRILADYAIKEMISKELNYFKDPYKHIERRIGDKELRHNIIEKYQINKETINKHWRSVTKLLKQDPTVACVECEDETGEIHLKWENLD